MRLSTIIIIVAALGVSVLTAFLIQWYLGSQTPSVEAKNEVVPAERVLVAKSDLAGGTVLKAKDHFRWRAWPAEGLNKNYVLKGSDLEKEFVGAVVRREIKAGSPITGKLVYRSGEKGFLASGLKPGMLAVAVKVDPIISVAGLVTPGDYVDVILTTTLSVGWDVEKDSIPRVNESRKVSETILRNIRVLAINQNADKLGKTSKKPKSATLEVNEKQAEILANVRRMGKLYLALRSHVQSETPAPPRALPFTTDLEVLSSLRGGLVSHINEQGNKAVTEFGLGRWLDLPEDASNQNNPQTAVQQPAPVETKPKIRIDSPALKPRALAPAVIKPLATPAKPKAVIVSKKPVQVVPAKKPAQAKAASVSDSKPVEKPAPAPVEPKTVRVDRAGSIQILKFKETQ
jgi:pilus assembly protein CpaB